MTRSFVNLHVHSAYSLLDGVAMPHQLVEAAKQQGQTAIAITDHANLYGAVQFYKTATSAGIKPIIGVEMYLVDDATQRDRSNMHIVLLVENEQGYQNLNHIMTIANTDGFYYVPRTDWRTLEQYHDGLIVTSACMRGVLSSAVLHDVMALAMERAQRLADIFGPDRFYIELMYHGIPGEDKIIAGLLDIHKQTGIPLVVTNDVHYIAPDDAQIRNILIDIHTKGSMKPETWPLHMRTREELEQVMQPFGVPQSAFDNTLKIADMCNYKMQLGINHMPAVPDAATVLEQLVNTGLKMRYGTNVPPDVLQRAEYELSIIHRMGFDGYFLIVQDYVNWAKQNGIAVGPGRGSAVGSVVSYALGITDIEPMQYNLLFERFLNPERVSMPDIDVDFGEGRNDVIQYISKKYGEDRVAQVMTVYYYGGRSAFRDVARVMGLPTAEVDAIANTIPDDAQLSDLDTSNMSEQIREALRIAAHIQGLPRHVSVHAGGVVIADKPLYHYVALERNTSDTIALDVVTQQDKWGIEDLGLLKMDLLGLKNLDVIEKCKQLIRQRYGIEPQIDINDPVIYSLLREGKVSGLFQVEGSGFREFLMHLQPTQFSDVFASLALFRPGTLDSGGAEAFIRRKHGLEPVDYYGVPELEPVLRETYGVIVYQEQIMQIASIIAGYSLGEADLLRRAIGKKKREIIEQQHADFVRRAVSRGYSTEVAERIYNVIEKFADYGFNKSHAVAYAAITMTTAWLKYYYTKEYYEDLLQVFNDVPDKVNEYLTELQRDGYTWTTPDINKSELNWHWDGEQFVQGLLSIKHMRVDVAQRIIDERNAHGPYTSLANLINRVRPDRGSLTGLQRSGALCSIGTERFDSELPSAVNRILDAVYLNVVKTPTIDIWDIPDAFILQRIQRVNGQSIFTVIDSKGQTYDVIIDDKTQLQDILASSRQLYDNALSSDVDSVLSGRTSAVLLDTIVLHGKLQPIGVSLFKLELT